MSALPAADAAAVPVTRGYIVVLDNSVTDPSALGGQQTRRIGGERSAVYSHALKGYAATLTADQAEKLAEQPHVRFVSPQHSYRNGPPRQPTTLTDCRPSPVDRQCRPVFIDRIRADRSSTRSGDGRGTVGVNVAVLDDGIDAEVPDLNVRGGVDCLSGSPVVPGLSLRDPGFHGTMVAGIIGARDDAQGLVGVAPGTPIWSVKVADDTGYISDAAFLCGLDWLASTRTDGDPANDIAIANMSLGSDPTEPPADMDDGHCGTVNDDAAHLAICNVTNHGVTSVVAAGNHTVDLARTVPAAYDEVITATAMADFDGKPGGKVKPLCYGRDFGFYGDADDEASLPFSNFARSTGDRRHTVAAPGVCMESNVPLPYHHAFGDGTSFASPAVAGVLALWVQTHRCGDSTPARNLRTLIGDAHTYNEQRPTYGFFGDPHRPVPGRYYGPLIAADRY
ncbi:S8 family serine peptidase [Streptomyces sp. TLI_105]|uniref:S8 family peptidase n=1 Tax=Streptomyces sp. TLI_105 TaxID=1881019 RepID=UPI0015A6C30E|nr:S8 family serine peptidase [Streptomyces sp. TLI_105]